MCILGLQQVSVKTHPVSRACQPFVASRLDRTCAGGSGTVQEVTKASANPGLDVDEREAGRRLGWKERLPVQRPWTGMVRTSRARVAGEGRPSSRAREGKQHGTDFHSYRKLGEALEGRAARSLCGTWGLSWERWRKGIGRMGRLGTGRHLWRSVSEERPPWASDLSSSNEREDDRSALLGGHLSTMPKRADSEVRRPGSCMANLYTAHCSHRAQAEQAGTPLLGRVWRACFGMACREPPCRALPEGAEAFPGPGCFSPLLRRHLLSCFLASVRELLSHPSL